MGQSPVATSIHEDGLYSYHLHGGPLRPIVLPPDMSTKFDLGAKSDTIGRGAYGVPRGEVVIMSTPSTTITAANGSDGRNVHSRQGVHHSRHRRLPGPRL